MEKLRLDPKVGRGKFNAGKEGPMAGNTSAARTIAPGILMERDVLVPMPDGVRLAANVFRPAAAQACPAILSVTPYGKDKLPDRKFMFLMRLAGVRFGKLDCSRWTGFEGPDPIFWVRQGYAVAQADVRGSP